VRTVDRHINQAIADNLDVKRGIAAENLQSTAGKIFADCGGSSCCPQTVPNRIWELTE
jgi:hypothetical protein